MQKENGEALGIEPARKAGWLLPRRYWLRFQNDRAKGRSGHSGDAWSVGALSRLRAHQSFGVEGRPSRVLLLQTERDGRIAEEEAIVGCYLVQCHFSLPEAFSGKLVTHSKRFAEL
ncbi:hypothetical protein MPNT_480002 [Candidatus Methylacidithermus pantelleriae]|uniref:Uncharacterized protein n=1 Tax=Candidatus Methylacidithermus pantelleriae TaxID=2744239 RepID=A0A8J2BUN7_9BACT|nr:hypothetical protein MPNT_480002 [Candidatus Methylacidithermus pantelleriae]